MLRYAKYKPIEKKITKYIEILFKNVILELDYDKYYLLVN